MKQVKNILSIFIVFLFFAMTACNVFPSGTVTLWRPVEGVWYCDDLQIQISYDREYETYAIVNGAKVICVAENDAGSISTSVICQELGHEKYDLGDAIFWGEYVELTDSVFILKDVHTKELYTFRRMH